MKCLQVAIAIISDGQGKFLFQHRKKQPYRGFLGLVGGKVEKNESVEEALIREVKEESGLDIHKFEYLGTVVETLITESKTTQVTLEVFRVLGNRILRASEEEGKVIWKNTKEFYEEKNRHIPTDWLIVKSLITNNKLITQIVVINKGEIYEVQCYQ